MARQKLVCSARLNRRLKKVRSVRQRGDAVRNLEVGTEQGLLRDAGQRSSDFFLFLRRWRAHVQHIDFHLRLG